MFSEINYRPGQANLQFLLCESHTIWTFQEFNVTKILCEIIFGQSRGAKTAVFGI